MTTFAPPLAVSGAGPAVSAAAPPVSGTARTGVGGAMRALTLLAIVGGAALAAIGFTGSYSALVLLGQEHRLGWFAHVFPIGVDAGIVVLLALDLHLIRRETPWPVLRLLAHTFTAATIVFNAAAAPGPLTADPVGAAMHAVIPVMFIAAVEAGRRLVIRMARIAAGHEPAGVPLHRWLLAPVRSGRMYRQMRLWAIPSYTQAVALERDRTVYRVMLERKHGDWRKAPPDALLPLTMAPYGLSVDEALALPQEAEEAERLREEARQAREIEAQTRAARRAADAEITRLRSQGDIATVRHAVEAETGVAEARARGARAEAEAAATVRARAATRDAEALDCAEAAEAQAREAEAKRVAAEARRATAEAERVAAEAERTTAEANRARAEEAERTARADEGAETARLHAADTRARIAELELRALEAEDAARLSPRERAARKVARLILIRGGGVAERVELQTIADALGVSTTTASERRREAAELIAGGYRPQAAPAGE